MKNSASFLRTFAVPTVVALATLGLGAAAYAASTVKPKEMTCEEFLALGTEVQPRVVYWMEGYSKSGKPEDAEIDMDALERPVAVVVTECRKAPRSTVWEKLKQYF